MTSLNSQEAAARAALLRYLGGKLQPLFPNRSIAGDLPAWLAPIPTSRLAESLRPDAAATADRLTLALVGGDVADVAGELEFLAQLEYPRLPTHRKLQLVNFAYTVRRLATDGDGTAKAAELYAEGYSSGTVAELMPKATRLLSLLGGVAAAQGARLPDEDTTPGARLATAGERAASRIAPLARVA